MFDYINTFPKDAPLIINFFSAREAIKLIKKRLRNNKKSAELYCYLSKAYIFLDDVKKAFFYAQKAYNLAPDYDYAAARYIYCYRRYKKKLPKELIELNNKLLNNSDFNPVIYRLLLIISHLRNKSQSQKEICKTIEKTLKNPTNEFEYELLLMAYSLLDTSKRKYCTLVNKIKKSCKETINLYFLYDKITYEFHYTYKDEKKALKYAEKMINLNNEYYLGYYRRVWIYYTLGMFDNALKDFLFLKKRGKLKNSDSLYISWCYHSKKESDSNNAIKYINETILSVKKNEYAYYTKGRIYYNEGDYEKALKNFCKAEQKGYSTGLMYAQMSYSYCKLNNQSQELKYANKAVLLSPNNSFCHYRRGFCLFSLNRYDDALKSFKEAERLKHYGFDYFEHIAYIYSLKNNYEEALKYINKQLLTKNSDTRLYMAKAYIYESMGKIKEANKNWEKYYNLLSP